MTAPDRVSGSLIPRATADQEAPEEPYFCHLEIEVTAEAMFYRGLRGLSKGGMADKKQTTAQLRPEPEGPTEKEPHCYGAHPPSPSPSSSSPTPTSKPTNHEPNTCCVQGPNCLIDGSHIALRIQFTGSPWMEQEDG